MKQGLRRLVFSMLGVGTASLLLLASGTADAADVREFPTDIVVAQAPVAAPPIVVPTPPAGVPPIVVPTRPTSVPPGPPSPKPAPPITPPGRP